MPYIGVSPQFGVRKKHTYTATAGQTSFSGAGSEGVTLSYTDSNFVDVYQNGVKLGDADYIATTGTSIVLVQGASVDDLVEIIVFDAFSAADTVSKTDGGTFDGAVTFGAGVAGVLDADGGITVDNITIDGTEIDLSSGDLTIDVAGDIILDADGGDIKLADNGTVFAEFTNDSTYLDIKNPNSNQDIMFKGVDGGSTITALQLDMSDAGRAIFNAGVSIGGNGAANTLDDYEEGTWTPVLTDGSSTLTIATPTAYYTKIGEYVHAEFYIQRTDSASNTATMIIQGLPFAHKAIPAIVGQCWIDNSSSDIRCFLYLPSNYSQLYFVKAGASSSYVSLNEFDNNRYIYAALDYHV